MNAKQLVEFAADLRLDVPGAKLALLVAVEGFESAEITRLRAEVERLLAANKANLLLASDQENVIERLRAEVEDLLSVCRGVVEWDKAEENHEGTTFYQRIEMWSTVKIGAYEAIDRHDATRATQGGKT